MEVFMFPGQGSQFRGMGAPLFDQVPEFYEREKEIDRQLGYSIRRLCTEDPENQLGNTQYTQPALYTVNALYYFKEIAGRASPKYLAGHSLGEYNALHAAGAFDFLTGLRLVQKRGEVMAQSRNGAMAAVIGLGDDKIKQLFDKHNLDTLDIANYNSPSQIVISGPEDDIKSAESILKEAGAQLFLQLPVSAAFHSRYMTEAVDAFAKFAATIDIQPIDVYVLSSVTGTLYPRGDSAALRSLLVRQIVSPVQWTQGIRYLIARGAASFKEIGPGNVLTRLVQQIRNG